jgi:hypothetical protein
MSTNYYIYKAGQKKNSSSAARGRQTKKMDGQKKIGGEKFCLFIIEV